MSFWKRSKRSTAQARSTGAAGQVQKRKKPIKRSPPVAMEVKLPALEALESGLAADEVGELIGVGPSTVHKWRKDYADEGIRVVALSVDRKGPAVVKRFVDQHGYTFPVAMAGGQLQAAYGGIRSIPTTFIIGPDGEVAEQMVGAHPMKDYLEAARRAKSSAGDA